MAGSLSKGPMSSPRGAAAARIIYLCKRQQGILGSNRSRRIAWPHWLGLPNPPASAIARKPVARLSRLREPPEHRPATAALARLSPAWRPSGAVRNAPRHERPHLRRARAPPPMPRGAARRRDSAKARPTLAKPAAPPPARGPSPLHPAHARRGRPRAALALPKARRWHCDARASAGAARGAHQATPDSPMHLRLEPRPDLQLQCAGAAEQLSCSRCARPAAATRCLLPCACVAARCPRARGRRRCGRRLGAAARLSA